MKKKNVLLELRKKHGLTQEEMAAKLFVTRQAVSRWETGETIPSVETLKIISKLFSLPIASLLGLEENRLCLFRQEEYTFCYRAAGILVRDGRVLLQKPNNTDEYAFPGGVVAIGETTSDALLRRWFEETGMHIEVGELKWFEENLFLLDGKPFQQICLDYIVTVKEESGLIADGFTAKTYSIDDPRAVCFYWIPLEEVGKLTVYPEKAAELLVKLEEPLKHLAYLDIR